MAGVVADSSFYILFYGDIGDPSILHTISEEYELHIGKVLKNELKMHLEPDRKIKQGLIDVSTDVDFVRLIEDYCDVIKIAFPDLGSWKDDGEFEAIGLSYVLRQYGKLKYLIIDDKKPRNFVLTNLDSIKQYLVRTIRFLYDAYGIDKTLNREQVLRTYEDILESIKRGRRPLSLTKGQWFKYVKPFMENIEGDGNGRQL